MAFKKIMSNVFGGFQVKRWLGYDQLTSNYKWIHTLFTEASNKKNSNIQYDQLETFEAWVYQLGLTEADLSKRLKQTKRGAVIYLCFGAISMTYAIYLLFYAGSLSAGFLATALTLFFLGSAFREHFNYFQIKQRRLGCTFKEWLLWIIKRR